jgi:hypothetical protein
MTTQYWLPTKPYTLIDAINRSALATGSVRFAELGANADYNGHRVEVSFNDYRRYWVAEYFWAGRCVISRGSFADVVRAAAAFHATQGRGGDVIVTTRDESEAETARALGFQLCTDETRAAHRATYADARFAEINRAADYERHGLAPAVGMLANSATIEEYRTKLEAFFAERKAARKANATGAVV